MIEIKYPYIKEKILLSTDKVFTLVIENSNLLYEFVINLLYTLNCEESKLFFLRKGAPISDFKNFSFIESVFHIDINNKKFLSILNKLIIQQLQTKMYDLHTSYQELFNLMHNIVEDFISPVTISEDVDYLKLVKLFNPSFCSEGATLFDKIIDYINVAIEFSELKLLIFLNVEDYLSESEILELIKICKYKEVRLFFIQSVHKYKLKEEKCLIIDSDLCEIIEIE